MNIGIASADITPPIGTDLCGYLAREKPSLGVLDPLYAKAVYLDDGGTNGRDATRRASCDRLLLIAADILAFRRDMVDAFRDWARDALHLEPRQIILAATHTHAGPATVQLNNCGSMDETYLRHLAERLRDVATRAMATTQPCDAMAVEAPLHLAIDRRNQPTAHTDARALAIAFRRTDGSFIATIINYAMHPVALGAINRQISGDFCAYAAAALSQNLPGNPLTLYTNGACGNLNPPAIDVTADGLRAMGGAIANALLPELKSAKTQSTDRLACRLENVPLLLEAWSTETIDTVANQYASRTWTAAPEWNRQFIEAIEIWRRSMKQQITQPNHDILDFDLQVIRLAGVYLVAVNGEMFSRFTDCVREKTGRPDVYTIGYANRGFGYIPTAAAYGEGGYEVETAHFFYNSFRPKKGGLELLCDRAAHMIRSLPQ